MPRGQTDDPAKTAGQLADPWYSINLAKLPEYIRIVESFGYTVTKNPEPVPEPVPDEVVPVPADGQPEDSRTAEK